MAGYYGEYNLALSERAKRYWMTRRFEYEMERRRERYRTTALLLDILYNISKRGEHIYETDAKAKDLGFKPKGNIFTRIFLGGEYELPEESRQTLFKRLGREIDILPGEKFTREDILRFYDLSMLRRFYDNTLNSLYNSETKTE